MNEIILSATETQVQNIQITRGREVLDKIEDDGFVKDWDNLYENCTWATAFQQSSFAISWYKQYHQSYEPVLVYEYGQEGLIGLLALALDGEGLIVGVGEAQAEYQVWLANSSAPVFINRAIETLQQAYPTRRIQLKYLPSGTPVVGFDESIQEKLFLKEVDQPILAVDYDKLTKELKKKNKKEKIRRLKRQGELVFEKVEDFASFEAIFDELAIQSDFRKGAMFDVLFFQEDPMRKDFLLDLFKQGLLHVTVLKVGDEIVASNVGVQGRGWVHLQGINTHSPMHAKHSPGILHFLMLGQKLCEEGYHSFDLTPGADGYKQSLSTDVIKAYYLAVYPTAKERKTVEKKDSMHQFMKSKLMKMGVSAYDLRDFRKQRAIWKQKLQLALKQKVFSFFKSPGSQKDFYQWQGETKEFSSTVEVKQNDLRSLLFYQNDNGVLTRWEFLEDAMKRLEAGQHCLTVVDQNKLIGCVWIRFSEHKKEIGKVNPSLPKNSLMMENFYFSGMSREEEMLMQFISTVSSRYPSRKIFILSQKKAMF